LTITSIESAIISRLTREAFMPSWPMAMPSETAIAVNSLGVHPASFTPRLALWASLPRWMLQGVASLHVEETPTRGRSKSPSVSPIALYIARCGALSGPSSVFLLSSFIGIIDTGVYFKIFSYSRVAVILTASIPSTLKTVSHIPHSALPLERSLAATSSFKQSHLGQRKEK